VADPVFLAVAQIGDSMNIYSGSHKIYFAAVFSEIPK
jgi:hypothetical protein